MNDRVMHRILEMLTSGAFYMCYVKLPSNRTPLEIEGNPKLSPFFGKCRGATDGSHIDMFVPDDALARYRNQKGGISQNALAICTFDMCFSYILSGWEGSASDGCIFENARRHDLVITPGTYLLADAGFLACDALLVPYHGVRYHLKEWGRALHRLVVSCTLFHSFV
jgi:hypothetical protein